MAMTWQEKYETARPSKVVVQEKPFADLEPGQHVVIPSPQDVEKAVWEVPLGETQTQREVRNSVARYHDADSACPAVTGIQLRVVSEMAVEALDAGVPPQAVAPFWRVLDPASNIAKKLPRGSERISALRRAETDPED